MNKRLLWKAFLGCVIANIIAQPIAIVLDAPPNLGVMLGFTVSMIVCSVLIARA
jgi:hypothetical protein